MAASSTAMPTGAAVVVSPCRERATDGGGSEALSSESVEGRDGRGRCRDYGVVPFPSAYFVVAATFDVPRVRPHDRAPGESRDPCFSSTSAAAA